LRKAQDQLIGDVDRSAIGNVANSVEMSSAATALKDERLTFVWLDGEVQKVSFQLRRCVSYQMKCSSYVKVVFFFSNAQENCASIY